MHVSKHLMWSAVKFNTCNYIYGLQMQRSMHRLCEYIVVPFLSIRYHNMYMLSWYYLHRLNCFEIRAIETTKYKPLPFYMAHISIRYVNSLDNTYQCTPGGQMKTSEFAHLLLDNMEGEAYEKKVTQIKCHWSRSIRPVSMHVSWECHAH